MYIQTEITPNDNTIKFLPGIKLLDKNKRIEMKTEREAAEISPLGESLFLIDGVDSVFIADNFISISKTTASDWIELKPIILTTILEHFSANLPLFHKSADLADNSLEKEFFDKKDEKIVLEIKELLSTRVRPFINQDGGDIIFRGFKDGIVYLVLLGACSGCSSASVTLYQGIENLLTHYIPAVKKIEPIE